MAPRNVSRTTPAAVNDAINFNYLVSLEEKENGGGGMLVTCRGTVVVVVVVLGGEGGLRFVLVLRGVFFPPWSMALEAFTLDRVALPFYEKHIQIRWEEGRQGGREGGKKLAQRNWPFITRACYWRLIFAF